MAAPAITHQFVSAIADGADATVVRPSNWNATHALANFTAASKLLGAGSAAATPDEITLGTNLSMSGTTLNAASGSGTVVFAAAPNSAFDLTNGGAGGNVTLVSKSITGISAGDQLLMEAYYSFLNNSGAGVQLVQGSSLGAFALSIPGAAGALSSSATARYLRRAQFLFSVSATSLTLGHGNTYGNTTGLNAGGSVAIATAESKYTWDTTASDFTGTQTLTLVASSSSTTTTQTLTLHAWTIRKISTV